MKYVIPILVIILLLPGLVFAEEEIESSLFSVDDGALIVEGTGIVPDGLYDNAEGKVLARLAAKVDAQRNLIEILQGLTLKSKTAVTNLAVQDKIETHVEGALRGARILPESEYFLDGVYHLKLKVTIKDLTPVVYPGPDREVKQDEDVRVPDETFTGLIINAKSFHLPENPLLLQIRDLKGNLIYSADRTLYQPTPAIFKLSMNEALSSAEVGENPLIVDAIKFDSHDNLTLIVSEGDGRLILSALENTDVFLLSKIAVITGGPKEDEEE